MIFNFIIKPDHIYVHYENFSIASANEKYRLTIGGFTGIGTDYFIGPHPKYSANQMKFSTPGSDNNRHPNSCAAVNYKRNGWWYNSCGFVYINKSGLLLTFST